MTERGPPEPRIPATPKATRSKVTDQSKGKEPLRNPPKQNPPKHNPPKQDPPLEPRVVIAPVDQGQDQDPLNPQNP